MRGTDNLTGGEPPPTIAFAADARSNIAVTADVSDLATLQGMLASPPPEVLAAMQAHGAVQPISIYVEADPETERAGLWRLGTR